VEGFGAQGFAAESGGLLCPSHINKYAFHRLVIGAAASFQLHYHCLCAKTRPAAVFGQNQSPLGFMEW
jgi:hypothetical protein